MAILNLKYTLPFVLGMLAFELIMKGLLSAICGTLNIPDFFVKLKLHKQDVDNEWNNYGNQRGFEYYEDKINYASSGNDISERLKKLK